MKLYLLGIYRFTRDSTCFELLVKVFIVLREFAL